MSGGATNTDGTPSLTGAFDADRGRRLTTGGLVSGRGGAYGQTGDIWRQLSGYGKGGQSHEEKQLTALGNIKGEITSLLTEFKQTWGNTGGGGGRGGGATVTR